MSNIVKALTICGLAVVGGCLSVVVLFGQEHPEEPHHHVEGQKLTNPVPSTPESIAKGAKIFAKPCVLCHGPTGKGDGAFAPEGSHPADLTDDVWQHGGSDGEIFLTIHNGIGPAFIMDSWQGVLSDEDIWNLVNYVKTLSAKK